MKIGKESGGCAAFTLLELLLAMAVVVAASTMICVTFGSVTKSWRRGANVAEDLHHGDFVLDQAVMGLRSAYYPHTAENAKGYGFWLEDGGSGEGAHDTISWVKLGTALTSSNSPTASGPHRVKLSVEGVAGGHDAAVVRIWRPYATAEDFTADAIEPEIISGRVVGLDCQVATNRISGEWEWEDVWEEDNTNRLPHAVLLTVYLAPLEPGGPAIEMARAVEIPVAHLSWRPQQQGKKK